MPEPVSRFVFSRALVRCDEASRLFSERRERRLSWREKWALFLHPWVCPPCRRHVRESRRLYALVRASAADETPPVPDAVRRRLEERVLRELSRND